MKRTFIAIPVKASPALGELIAQLRAEFRGDAINWVEPAKMHLTLKFLGDTPDHLIAPISQWLEDTVSGFSQDKGWLRGVDYFSYKGNPSVLFANLEDLSLPGKLAAMLEEGLQEFGFPAENRKFNAHLTLARIKFLKDKRGFTRLIDTYKGREIQQVSLERVVLYESLLFPGGPVYEPIKSFPLRSS